MIHETHENNIKKNLKGGYDFRLSSSPPETMTIFNQKLLRGVQMLHGAVFSKRAPLAAGGKNENINH
jgi:hypothetical protein